MKTTKSYTKRLKVTKNGKILGRTPGFNHFNSKQSRTTQLAGRKTKIFNITKKAQSHLMPVFK